MRQGETKRYADLLRAKQMELSHSLRCRDEIAIEKASDTLDAVQLMRERELAVQNLDRDSNLLRQIRDALSRIVQGTYGICLHCGEDISPKRLAALPWAAYCLPCQQHVDRGEINTDETIEPLVRAA